MPPYSVGNDLRSPTHVRILALRLALAGPVAVVLLHCRLLVETGIIAAAALGYKRALPICLRRPREPSRIFFRPPLAAGPQTTPSRPEHRLVVFPCPSSPA